MSHKPELSRKSRLNKLMTGVVIAISVGLLYYFAVRLLGFGIPCPTYQFMGIYCPGCGTTRMLSALISFDFASAFKYQPVMLCSLLPLSFCFGASAVKYIKDGTKSLSRWQSAILYGVITVLVVFCIIRNLNMFLK